MKLCVQLTLKADGRLLREALTQVVALKHLRHVFKAVEREQAMPAALSS